MCNHQGAFQRKGERRHALHHTSFRHRVRDYDPLPANHNHYRNSSIGPEGPSEGKPGSPALSSDANVAEMVDALALGAGGCRG